MDLDKFVTTVLTDVVSGIQEAQKSENTGAYIVPRGDGGHKYPDNSRVSNSARIKSTIIDFDIAVTVETSESAHGGGGLKVAGIGASLGADTSSKDTKISRIQFGVPILLPQSEKKWVKDRE